MYNATQFTITTSVEMESFLHRRGEESVPQDLLGRVVGQLEVVHARVDGRIAAVRAVHLAHDGEAGLQVGEAAGRQRRAPGGELQEALALVSVHVHHHVHEPLESRAATGANNASEKPRAYQKV